MKRKIFCLILMFAPAAGLAEEKLPPLPMFQRNSLLISALGGYSIANMYGQADVPSYKGPSYGAELEYEFRIEELTLSPFLGYHFVDLENSANTALQSESIQGSKALAGVRIGSRLIFAKAAAAWANFKDKSEGTISNTLDLKSTGFELGAGLVYPVSRPVSLRISLDYTYFKFDPSHSSISQRLDMVSYTASLALIYVVPSGK